MMALAFAYVNVMIVVALSFHRLRCTAEQLTNGINTTRRSYLCPAGLDHIRLTHSNYTRRLLRFRCSCALRFGTMPELYSDHFLATVTRAVAATAVKQPEESA